jgi:hypothetical protein
VRGRGGQPARLAATLCSVAFLGALAPGGFRFSRPVEAPSGWSRLALPDDVLDVCRPGIPDLRLTAASEEEVPYALEETIASRASRFPLTDVESTSRRETTAILDRGVGAPLARSVDLEIAEAEFLKPVVLEASADRASFREIARGSVFAARGARSTTLRFPPNDRRYWRLRFDDRNGDPIHPTAARVDPAGTPPTSREIPLTWSLTRDEPAVLAARLPAANLGVTAVRVSVADPAFERPARVYERIFFRDEVVRRLVGSGLLRRAPGGPEETEIAVCDPAGRNLEIDIVNGDTPPLRVTGLTALGRSRSILFYATGSVTLLYGSLSAPAPRYDVARALSRGEPPSVANATLGPPRELTPAGAVALPPRGAPLSAGEWKIHQPVRNLSAGVAYLDLSGRLASELSTVRLIDAANRQIPYVVERGARSRILAATLRSSQKETRTLVEISGFDPADRPDAITLSAASPEFFSREVRVFEVERDARGPAGDRILGTARWERQPGAPPASLTIPIAPPQEKTITVEIENGDNSPLAVTAAQLHVPFVRIDFVPPPGETVTLLSDNPQASAPRYDFAMVADRVLAAPAQPAALGPAAAAPPPAGLPSWFWIAVAAAALLVLASLARTLRTETPGTG